MVHLVCFTIQKNFDRSSFNFAVLIGNLNFVNTHSWMGSFAAVFKIILLWSKLQTPQKTELFATNKFSLSLISRSGHLLIIFLTASIFLHRQIVLLLKVQIWHIFIVVKITSNKTTSCQKIYFITPQKFGENCTKEIIREVNYRTNRGPTDNSYLECSGSVPQNHCTLHYQGIHVS